MRANYIPLNELERLLTIAWERMKQNKEIRTALEKILDAGPPDSGILSGFAPCVLSEVAR